MVRCEMCEKTVASKVFDRDGHEVSASIRLGEVAFKNHKCPYVHFGMSITYLPHGPGAKTKRAKVSKTGDDSLDAVLGL